MEAFEAAQRLGQEPLALNRGAPTASSPCPGPGSTAPPEKPRKKKLTLLMERVGCTCQRSLKKGCPSTCLQQNNKRGESASGTTNI